MGCLLRWLCVLCFAWVAVVNVAMAGEDELGTQYPFNVETTEMAAGDVFQFKISAAGTFYVDCGDSGVLSGDGVVDNTITRYGTGSVVYTCTYPEIGAHTVKFGGLASAYHLNSFDTTIGFNITGNASDANVQKIDSVYGSLGPVFVRVTNGRILPMFYRTFWGAKNLKHISADLFDGIIGPIDRQYANTFEGCTGLTAVPDGLFRNVKNGANYLFDSTFRGCSGITDIPGNLFNHIRNSGAFMFARTFYGCGRLKNIPSQLFNGFTGAAHMFEQTFAGCGNITDIPENLFSSVTIAADCMFNNTFYACSGIKTVPYRLFSRISSVEQGAFHGCFHMCKNLGTVTKDGETYGYIPDGMFPDNTSNSVDVYTDIFRTTAFTSVPCPVNMYRQNVVNGWGNTPAVCWPCPDGLVAPSGSVGAEACTACIDGYGPNFETGLCQIKCGGGTYVAHAGGGCVDVETGYWAPISSVTYGAVGVRNACPSDLHTTGRGIGADELGDCGRILHFGAHTLHLRSQKRTTPSLNVQIGDHRLYGDMTTEQRGHLRLRVDDTVYSVHNPDADE